MHRFDTSMGDLQATLILKVGLIGGLMACLSYGILTPRAHASALPSQQQASFRLAAKLSEAEARQLFGDLQKAIESDDQDGVIKVLEKGFPANFADNEGNSMLMQAAQHGKCNALSALIAGGAKLDAMSKNGTTALMQASYQGHASCVSMLITMEADLNLHGPGKPAPLHLAVLGNHADVIRFLVAAKADLGSLDDKGLIPLELAFLARKQAALDQLRPFYRNEGKLVPMFWSAQSLHVALSEKNTRNVLRMLASGIDPNGKLEGSEGSVPLETAINHGHAEGLNFLLLAGADPNYVLPGPGVPVWWLAMTADGQRPADPRILQVLIKAGAKLDVAGPKGITPLSYAKSQPNPEFAKILTAAGAK